MGRPKKTDNEKKVKVSISLERRLYEMIKKDNYKPSRIIEKLIKDFYGKKDL